MKIGKTPHPTPYTLHPAPRKNFFSRPYLVVRLIEARTKALGYLDHNVLPDKLCAARIFLKDALAESFSDLVTGFPCENLDRKGFGLLSTRD